MHKRTIFAALVYLMMSLTTTCVVANDRINIEIPSVEDEIEYVWRTLQDVPFFIKHGYEISLPDHPVIKVLVKKSKNSKLENSDRDSLEQLMRNTIYDRTLYQLAFEKIKARQSLLNQLINRLDKIKKNWNYQSYKSYQVRLTLYGPGGSFNPDNGSVLIFATPDGSFKQYKDPACTIIHEVVHIGIEKSIVSRLGVPHALKERVVDRIVELSFQKELPEYRVQNMGYEELDGHLNGPKDIENLSKILEGFLGKSQGH